MDDFENLGWRERQMALVTLRELESSVNLKTLPVATLLASIAAGLLGLWIGQFTGDEKAVSLTGAILFLTAAAIVLWWGMKSHSRKESCLLAWTEALKDSHALITKEEEPTKTNKPTRAWWQWRR